jgi:hypothetical protein
MARGLFLFGQIDDFPAKAGKLIQERLFHMVVLIEFVFFGWFHPSTSQYPPLGEPTRFNSPIVFNFSMFLSMAVVLMPIVSAISLFDMRGLPLVICRILF